MEIAFNEATTLSSSTLEQDLQLCEQFGYDYIEIRLDKLKEYLIHHTVEDLVNFFNTSNLKPLSLNAIEFFTFQNKTSFALMEKDLRLLAEIGERIGCSTIVVVPSFDIGHKTKTEIKEETVQCLERLVSIIEHTSMKLALEFVGYPNCSINTIHQANEIIETMDHPQIGLVVDCFHVYAMNSNLEDLRHVKDENILLFHIDDCEDLPQGSLRDWHRLWPGDGVIPIEEIYNILREKGFKGPASVELFRPAYWELPPEQCIQVAKQRVADVLETCNSNYFLQKG
ncbi:sugar phosphate isomerase/epimerase [Pontibacillus sp. HMF3514]|uniref:sugar phosphate isomerase/epimerase family protein n=1 Tax=Pontibacillus sp. HMF3514 TaxID=2692425 RepID=UPI00131FA362|nr:sugar phosphate isomerase/epimerase [Pontibacillus sp. HMF3514]QHE51695.1 TIM barrel protein [Pontibacillus sp. HMF3514]